MKKPLVALLAALALGGARFPTATRSDPTAAKPDPGRIYGKLQDVTALADYKVEVVTACEDLAVREGGLVARQPGPEWQIVTSLPDYKIQRVFAFADFKVRSVTSLPGPRPEPR